MQGRMRRLNLATTYKKARVFMMSLSPVFLCFFHMAFDTKTYDTGIRSMTTGNPQMDADETLQANCSWGVGKWKDHAVQRMPPKTIPA
jgi:hypothetical protein